MSYVEYLTKPSISEIKCVILDYDGTLTTFRKGWEFILYPYVKNLIDKNHNKDTNPELEVDLEHLVAHAGGTTPRQLMGRLADLVEKYTGKSESIEHYVSEYGKIFNAEIARRVDSFDDDSESYVISGVRQLLEFLKSKKTLNYVVTGSCGKAVTKELAILSMRDDFLGVYGADGSTIGNHKELAIEEIITKHGLLASEVLIVGDGSTEMRAAVKMNLPSLGIASDEHNGGLCSQKRTLLVDIGANAIVEDYINFKDVWEWLHE